MDYRTERALRELGLTSFDDIFVEPPQEIRERIGADTPSEPSSLLGALSAFGEDISFLGAGLYDYGGAHSLDEQVARMNFFHNEGAVADRSASALEALARYQDAAARVSGMDVALASIYRDDSAVARACYLAALTTGRKLVVMSTTVSPESRRLVERYASAGLIELRVVGERDGLTDLDELASLLKTPDVADQVAATVTQYPNFYGNLERMNQVVALARSVGALAIALVEPCAASALKSPRHWGFDLVAWDARRATSDERSSRAHLGFIAITNDLLRALPTRFLTALEDEEGASVLRLTFSSDRVSASRDGVIPEDGYRALLELARLAFVDERDLALGSALSRNLASYAREELAKAGFDFHHAAPFWREFAVKVDDPVGMNAYLRRWGIVGGFELQDGLLLAFTEKRAREEIDELVYFMKEYQFGGAS
ncbi:MAG: hypothetical protein IJU03_05740 [Thermoguttaceae bacterium]|nr:hypothetical protein [Thermoguttaceae bacterium]